jgi:chaperonin GroES
MSFNILHDRIAVVADPAEEEVTKSGLVVPGTSQNKIAFGTVTHVGLGRVSELNAERIGLDVKVGDRVFFHRAAGRDFSVGGEDYLLLTNEEILGVEVND